MMQTKIVKKYTKKRASRWDPIIIGLENQKLKEINHSHIYSSNISQFYKFVHDITDLAKKSLLNI